MRARTRAALAAICLAGCAASGANAKLEAGFSTPSRAWVRDPESKVWLTVEEQPGGLVAARMHCQSDDLGHRVTPISLDEPANGGRATVRCIALHETPHGTQRDYRQWIDTGERTFRVFSQYPEGERDKWEAEIPALAGRIQLHTVAEGETLDAIAKRYAVWSVDALAVYNDRAVDAALAPGARLKLIARQPLDR